jgi:ribosomal protein L40E
MESTTESRQLPLKICRRCSIGSRTDAERCPNCGRRYRRRWQAWALAVAIVVLAFAAGYTGRQLLSNDSGDKGSSAEITAEQAGAIPLGISRPELVDRLDTDPTVVQPVGRGQICLFYPLADHPDSAWAFCFARGKLTSSSSASGSGATRPG